MLTQPNQQPRATMPLVHSRHLSAANTAASATSADAQSVVDGQVSTLNTAISAYNAAIVPASDVSLLTTAKATAQGLITANAAESTTPGDHAVGSLATLSAANTAASATSADAQSVVDGQVSTLNTAISAYNAAMVGPSDVSAYNATLAAVTESNYTTVSWSTYQGVVAANVVTTANSQTEVNTATSNITTAQGSLVTVLADAQTTAHSALTTALTTYTETNYTSGDWTTLTGFKTAGDTAIDAATDLAGAT